MKTELSYEKDSTNGVVVACPVMKNNHNVSMIVRAASCFGASRVVITGQNKVNQHVSRDHNIEVVHKNSLTSLMKNCLIAGYRTIALEQNERATSIYDYQWPSGRPILITMGSEAKGTNQEILDLCHDIVEIPLCGEPYSLNVAMSVSIVLNEIARQRMERI